MYKNNSKSQTESDCYQDAVLTDNSIAPDARNYATCCANCFATVGWVALLALLAACRRFLSFHASNGSGAWHQNIAKSEHLYKFGMNKHTHTRLS